MTTSAIEQPHPSQENPGLIQIKQSQGQASSISRLRKRPSLKKKIKEDKKSGKRKISKNFNRSLWDLKENFLYMHFLLQNQQLFYIPKLERKAIKLNVMMGRCVKTRSADQCRSHHQKMIKYHQDIPNIISHIKGLLKEQEGDEFCTQQKQENIYEEKESFIAENPPVFSTQELSEHWPDLFSEPLYDWDYWNNLDQMAEQQKYVEEWFNVVDGKYSHY